MIQPPLAPGDRRVPWLDQCPRDWRFKPLKYLCGINKRVLAETTEQEAEFRYLDISSVNSDGRWTASELMTFAEAPSRARRVLVGGDVLISTVRTYLRAITHVETVQENLVCSTGFVVLSASNQVDPRFLSYWVRSTYFVDEVVARSVGVSYPAVNPSDIGSLPFPVIEVGYQRAIAAFLDRETARIDELIAKKERQIELLQEKRAALIHEAIQESETRNLRLGAVSDQVFRAVNRRDEECYVPIGLYNLGRGIFHKEPTQGTDLGDSDFYWIEADDLVLRAR